MIDFQNLFYCIDSFRNEDDFIVSLLLMGAIFAFFALMVGIAVLIIVSVIVFFLISGGIISTSVLVGFQQKSASKGFKTFFILLCSLGTSVISVVFFWVFNSVYDWWPSNYVTLFVGTLFGVFSGWLLGLLMFYASKKMVLFLKNKLQKRLNKE